MTITQLIKSSPVNANELFAKLAATTNGAGKTRETLFAELKAELELHSRLEEAHIFPALRKHKETRALVQEAVADNRRARALIEELEAMPKQGEEFLGRLADLRKVFQQHVRDEKKELLPAVMQALSSEEMQAITEKVEAEKAAVEEIKQREADERRTAAREEREKVERRRAQAEARQQRAEEEERQQHAEIRAEQRRLREEEKAREAELEAERNREQEIGAALTRTAETLVGSSQAIVEMTNEAAQAGASASLESTGQVASVVVDAAERTHGVVANTARSYTDATGPALEAIRALAVLPAVTSDAAVRGGQVYLDWVTRSAEIRSRRSAGLYGFPTPLQAARVQTRYFGETMQAWLEANTRMLDLTMDAFSGMAARNDETRGR